jgi:hypothetical protein
MGRCEAQFKDQEVFAGIPNLWQQTEPIQISVFRITASYEFPGLNHPGSGGQGCNHVPLEASFGSASRSWLIDGNRTGQSVAAS